MRPAWKVFLACGAISAAVTLPELYFFDACRQSAILSFFQDHLREPLFSGLLAVAAFLFSLKTFIIVTMKENVYGTPEYAKRLEEFKKLKPTLKRYEPLEDFSMLLFLAVLATLVSAIVQFSVGFFNAPWAAAISICTAIWSIALIFISLVYMQMNLRMWFKLLDSA